MFFVDENHEEFYRVSRGGSPVDDATGRPTVESLTDESDDEITGADDTDVS